MIKIIELSCMLDGVNMNREPDKSVERKAQEIFEKNLNYKYVDMKYKDPGRTINMEYATLIIDDGK